MQLILIRHGIAEELGGQVTTDSQRELTDEGVEKTTEVAAGLRALGSRPAILATSPLVRAVQTAQIVHKRFHRYPTLEVWPELENADYSALLGRLRRLDWGTEEQVIALVGHEPGMSRFAARLLCGNAAGLQLDFKKAGVCALELEIKSATPQATLCWFAPPRLLRRAGEK